MPSKTFDIDGATITVEITPVGAEHGHVIETRDNGNVHRQFIGWGVRQRPSPGGGSTTIVPTGQQIAASIARGQAVYDNMDETEVRRRLGLAQPGESPAASKPGRGNEAP